jgi:hypothetical protein
VTGEHPCYHSTSATLRGSMAAVLRGKPDSAMSLRRGGATTRTLHCRTTEAQLFNRRTSARSHVCCGSSKCVTRIAEQQRHDRNAISTLSTATVQHDFEASWQCCGGTAAAAPPQVWHKTATRRASGATLRLQQSGDKTVAQECGGDVAQH